MLNRIRSRRPNASSILTVIPSTPSSTSTTSFSTTATRNATLLRRPKRPYTFTQLVTLSDGSSFLQRTTSPAPVYKSIKDVRNTLLWNPSSARLTNVEEDEAGRLARFRERFGRGWDAGANAAEAGPDEEDGAGGAGAGGEGKAGGAGRDEESLLDLISGYQPREGDGKAGQMNSGQLGNKKK